MKYVTANQKLFEPTVFSRGKNYYDTGKVEIVNMTPFSITAKVNGSSAYRVSISFQPNCVIKEARCDCPYFTSNRLCKHVAAVLVAFDQEKGMAPAMENRPVFGTNMQRFSTELANILTLKPATYFQEAEIIFQKYKDTLRIEDLIQARKDILTESLGHGGMSGSTLLGEKAVDFLNDMPAESMERCFTMLYGALPSQQARTRMLELTLGHPTYQGFINALSKTIPAEFGRQINWISARHPDVNFYRGFDNEALTAMVKANRFPTESASAFLEACVENKAEGALLASLSSGYTLPEEDMATILSYFKVNTDRAKYLSAMEKTLDKVGLSFNVACDFYHSLTAEERSIYARKIHNRFAYTIHETDVELLLSPSSFTTSQFSRLTTAGLIGCHAEMKALGEIFYVKPLIRRLKKDVKKAEENRLTPPELDDDLSLIKLYGENQEIASMALDPGFSRVSFTNPSIRFLYLTTLKSLGLKAPGSEEY